MKFLLLIIFLATNALAWGPEGHMIVAEIAQKELTAKAQAAVTDLLRGQSLADVSNWADTIKGQAEWTHTKPWHFVDVPDGETYDSIEHSHDGDTIVAITELVAVLKSKSVDPITKQNALKFIVHFVGDIHQPLHVGRPSDRGGNSTKIIFEGRNSNLHAFWDSGIISEENMDYVTYARRISTQSSFMESYDLPELSFSQIIAESLKARPDIYNFKSPSDQGPIQLDQAYLKRNLAFMNSRLLIGGKRLAALLNTVYKN
jgi:hypothetical protein